VVLPPGATSPVASLFSGPNNVALRIVPDGFCSFQPHTSLNLAGLSLPFLIVTSEHR
jgi:hypothetical protein